MFEVGTNYYMRSPADQNCIWAFEVVARTAKTVTLVGDGFRGRKSFRVREYDGAEEVMPLGRFSMAPCLRSTRVLHVEPGECRTDATNFLMVPVHMRY